LRDKRFSGLANSLGTSLEQVHARRSVRVRDGNNLGACYA
jgi:hypothetical protein